MYTSLDYRWTPVLLLLVSVVTNAQVLDPPYFNLAEGRKITSTATCGDGVAEPELYCKLVGATLDLKDNPNINLIQGQVCDYCDPNDPKTAHPAEYAIDGTERWWQSPPLSRGNKFNEVNLTIDLGQEFHVAYVFIKMANSPRPGIFVLERSIDHGDTFEPWQYFADTPSDCVANFGVESLQPITRDNSVICETKFSKVVPLENGEIVVSLLNGRPSAENFSHSMELQEWTKATTVRLRLLRTKTLLGHLMSVARQDPTVTRRYFYSVKDINIGGRCVCNGHAETCDITDPANPFMLLCRCQHHTCGPQCEQCCPGFVQKKWRGASVDNPHECEPCNCFGHTDDCYYDEEVDRKQESLDTYGVYTGGGVCRHCRHNTEGINCDRCKNGFYRPFGKPLNATDVCHICDCDPAYSTGNCADGTGQCECRPEFLPPYCDRCNFGYYGYPECKPCDCHLNGTYGSVCEVGGGQCPCKPNYMGKYCDRCAEGYYGFPDCLPCDCNSVGSLNPDCEITSGQCSCRSSYGGRQCNRCDVGFFNYPNCEYCSCDFTGSTEEVCNNVTGNCLCRPEFGGVRCDLCAPGYFGYPHCAACGCNEQGSINSVCDNTGRCRCMISFAGQKCDQCSPGFYSYPDCHACDCDQSGSLGLSCDRDGRCVCRASFDGEKCNKCREGFYNYPLCEDCNCNPSGVVSTFAGCGSLTDGELCECKDRVVGRICNKCKPLYWNLKTNNPLGCEDCNCYKPGTMGAVGVCLGDEGQCMCKPNVGSRQCNQCRDGFYQLVEDNLFGCKDCNCDIGGSVNRVCDKSTGQCSCRPRVNGQRCNKPLQTHYFPNLHQLQYELEDGRTPSGTLVRYGFDQHIFPKFSWRGYAIFSDIQKEVLMDVYIDKPSLYHVLLRYLNFGGENVYGSVTFTPDVFTETQQSSDMVFEPTREPKFVRVSGKNGVIASPFVINPGRWTISIKVERPLFVDYLVLLPQAYYEATLLQEVVSTPCALEQEPGLCQQFAYPYWMPDEVYVSRGEAGYAPNGDQRARTQLFSDEKILQKLGIDDMAWLNQDQNTLHMDLRVPKPGRYILVVTYHTPDGGRTNNLVVDVATTDQMDKGKATLYDCNYSFVCRQVVADREGKVAVFNIETNHVSLTLTAEEDVSLAIDRVVAIPYEKWHVDYIMPKPMCIMENGTCKDTTFPRTLPEAVKIEFESGFNEDRVAEEQPTHLQDLDVKLVYLDHKDPMVDVSGSVSQTGPYTFVVHYYQPNNPAFDMDVLIQNGQFYEAILPLNHCPNRAGCRSVIVGKEANRTSFQILKNFVLTLKEPNHKSVWVDYVLAIPSDQFDESILYPEREDKAGEFLSKCGRSDFDITTDTEGFCKDALFSLTSEYNNGALICQCDIDGSLSFECEEFGGQCQCKPNVIGRMCSQCQTGYFGFPDCRPCGCPSTSVCHPITGQCICPPRVTGDKCDTCVANTYGLDPIIGCEECNCVSLGVHRGNLQCDLHTGQCQCKANIAGRSCDHCQAGHWAFPYCQLCNCDLRGTTEGICDQVTSQCFCKENTHGEYCDQCKPGTFFLEEHNPLGCTKCFCFGATDRCTSAYYSRTQIIDMENWKGKSVPLDNIFHDEADEIPLTVSGTTIRTIAPEDSSDSYFQHLYFAAPEAYLGNKILSYGGNISYSIITAVNPDVASVGIAGPGDIILYGSNHTLVHHNIEQPAANVPMDMNVRIVEREFTHTTGSEVSREQLMMVLVNLEAIYIRASYFRPAEEVRVTNIIMDSAVEEYIVDAPQAIRVERCQCPASYRGSSCEECAAGHYRAKTGPYLGYCVPCQCNGHADSCDVETGQCYDCKHNTIGEHCEICAPGYHGDATQGAPYDCLICACPLPIESNNFAESCEVSPTGMEISCKCKPGYYGPRCDVCAAGYFGEPEVPGSSCQSCLCSGNIDPGRPDSCDSVTGECVVCLNNTFGPACELCAPGFYGDAIRRKDCRQCDCGECGTDFCEHSTGQCACKNNVIGSRCEECRPGHWGFSSCYGCRDCRCAGASRGLQCDLETGQCPCQQGATGLTCDVCDSGFWKYSSEGCISCNCDLKYSAGAGCDPTTGQCQCLEGVVGEKCDSCPYRWAFLEKKGCQKCGPCVHALLDDTDHLRSIIDPIRHELKDISGSYFAYRRLEFVNQSATDLRPAVDDLIFDPNSVDLSPTEANLESIEQTSEHLTRRAKDVLVSGEEIGNVDAPRLVEDALEVEKLARETTRKVQKIVAEIQNLAEGLHIAAAANIDRFTKEANKILEELEGRSFDQTKNESQQDFVEALEMLEYVKDFQVPSLQNREAFDSVKESLDRLKELLRDLRNHTDISKKLAEKAETLNENSKKNPIRGLIQQITTSSEFSERTLTEAEDLLEQAKKFFGNAQDAFETLEEDLRTMEEKVEELREQLRTVDDDVNDVSPLVDDAREHANRLMERAQQLDSLLSNARVTSNDAVKAANAYKDIANAINSALEAAEEANLSADEAITMTDGVADGATDSLNRSRALLEEARRLLTVGEELEPRLEDAKNTVIQLEKQNSEADTGLKRINQELDKLPTGSVGAAAASAGQEALEANTNAREARDRIQNILDRLPEEEERAERVPRELDEANQAIKASNNYVDRVASLVPDITNLMGRIDEKDARLRVEQVDISDKIAALKHKVALARDQANRIKLGVHFYPNNSLQLLNPDGLTRATTYTQMSMYFRTSERDGLLAYVGNEIGTHQRLKRTLTDDYMALELREGRLVLTMDLGTGAAQIVNNQFVSDGTWHQVIIDRTGKTANLIVRTEDEPDEISEGYLPGTYSVFNLDQHNSKFFVGGIPESAKIQNEVRNQRFTGCIEGLEFGKTPLGLWNFVHAENKVGSGCEERDKLVIADSTNGLRFDGSGYVILPRGKDVFRLETSLLMRFKTYAANGLLFLVGRGEDFFALELEDGYVIMKYNLGGGVTSIRTPNQYNDGQWHSVDAGRERKGALLKMDGSFIEETEAPGKDEKLATTENIYIGGYPGTHNFKDVSNVGFDGCIMDVQVLTDIRDLNNNKEALGVVSGCPESIARTVSFGNESAGYIGMPNTNIEEIAQFTFKFKTLKSDGLLLFIANEDQSNYLSISLFAGSLVMRTEPGGEVRTSPEVKYNSGEWHYVTATKNGEFLRLDIDDVDSVETKLSTRPSVVTTTPLYFGGVPEDYVLQADVAASTENFIGCIGDTTVNSKFQNFAATQDKEGASLARCPLADPTYVDEPRIRVTTQSPRPDEQTDEPDEGQITSRPTLSPTTTEEEEEVTTTTEPPVTTEEEEEDITTESPVEVTTIPMDTCKLPLEPEEDEDIPPDFGYRFGSHNDSHLEFVLYSSVIPTLSDESHFALEFKTTLDDGVMLYVSGTNHADFVGIFLVAGKVAYLFNCGSGPAYIVSQSKYNDGQWHRAVITRIGKEGRLQVDEDPEVMGSSTGSTNSVDVRSPVYIGGLSDATASEAKASLKQVKSSLGSFPGCIRNVEVQNTILRNPRHSIHVQGCSDYAEDGTFFYSDGGYITLYDRYKVGRNLDVILMVKPRSDSGVLMSVHGNIDFVVLQMVEGNLVFNVDNGAGMLNATIPLPHRHHLCDGNWHEIRVAKAGNVLSATIDNKYIALSIGSSGVNSAETNGPLYFGGVPNPGSTTGVETSEQYVGCLRVQSLRNKVPSRSNARAYGKVSLSYCSTI